MNNNFCVVTALALFLLIACLIYLRKTCKKLNQIQREKDDILSEELRMFDFFHHLGEVIEKNVSHRQLHREVVEGFSKVLDADGGVLYFLSEDQKYLVPKYISANCPPLIEVSACLRNRLEHDRQALESYLRLTKVPVGEGLLGKVMTNGGGLYIPDVKAHESFAGAESGYKEELSALIAPLHYGGKNLGVVAIVRQHDSNTGQFSANDFEVFNSASEQSAFALGNAMIHQELVEKRKLEAEVRMASEVQGILLPSEEPQIPGYRVYGKNTPARMISGDYFDYIHLDSENTGVVIADVTGKGVPAGLLMVMCRSVLRLTAKAVRAPSEALSLVNRHLFPDVREDMFVSLAYVILEHSTGNLTISRAGHDAPLLFRSVSREIEVVKPPGLAIGIDEGDVFERVTKDQVLKMNSGDCLLLYTDGICEAVDSDEAEFGKERLKEIFLQSAPSGAKATMEVIQQAVASFAGDEPQMDDITLIVIEKL